MTKLLLLFSLLCGPLAATAQGKLSYRLQAVDVAPYPNGTFEVRGHLLIEGKSKNGGAVLDFFAPANRPAASGR